MHMVNFLSMRKFYICRILFSNWYKISGELEVIQANLGAIVYISVICTAIFVYLESAAQRWVPGSEVAILRTLEPVIAAVLSFWLLGETFKTFDFIGAGMVLAAMVLVINPRNGDQGSLVRSAKLEEEEN